MREQVLSEVIKSEGFSAQTLVAAVAVLLGAKKVRDIHNLSQEDLQIIYKAEAGSTPRTVADLESGEVIKELIKQEFPDDAINEEESGVTKGLTHNVWYVDPLDGTSSFARGQKYSTLGVGVYENGRPMFASICSPFEQELLLVEAARGAWMFSLDSNFETVSKIKRLCVSTVNSLKGAIIYVDALFNDKTALRKLAFMKRLVELSGGNINFRMTGSNIDQQRQVATGRAEATITDAVGGFYDLAAGSLTIQEAGGKFTDIFGNPVTEATQVAVGSNSLVYDQLLPLLQECYEGYEGFR